MVVRCPRVAELSCISSQPRVPPGFDDIQTANAGWVVGFGNSWADEVEETYSELLAKKTYRPCSISQLTKGLFVQSLVRELSVDASRMATTSIEFITNSRRREHRHTAFAPQ